MIRAIATDFESFRNEARKLLQADVKPEDASWESEETPSLFATTTLPSEIASTNSKTTPKIPASFVERAEVAAENAAPDRFALLYRLLFRISHGERACHLDPLDRDAIRLRTLVREVREEEHRMHAFVRFRPVKTSAIRDQPETWVSWFRPAHPILRRVAPFFARRYPDVCWTIFTPELSAFWDKHELRFGPGANENEMPSPDALDDLFATYYGNIFNPARVNLDAYAKHVPSRIRVQLPEARALPEMIRNSSLQVATLTAERAPPSVMLPQARDLESLAHAAGDCRACPIGKSATQIVFGEGPRDAKIMIVGEQPGDEEDRVGRPFIGPAGKVLDDLLARAGLDRSRIYLTNAVKHFKWAPMPRGKRRMHSRPNAGEIATCHDWLRAEIDAIRPQMILCLGNSAGQSFVGSKLRVARDRGRATATPWAPWWMVSYHPSALLRAPDEAAREKMERELLSDLIQAREHLDSLM